MFEEYINSISMSLWKLDKDTSLTCENINEVFEHLLPKNIHKVNLWKNILHYKDDRVNYYTFVKYIEGIDVYIYVYINNNIDLSKEEASEIFTAYYNKKLRIYKINKLL